MYLRPFQPVDSRSVWGAEGIHRWFLSVRQAAFCWVHWSLQTCSLTRICRKLRKRKPSSARRKKHNKKLKQDKAIVFVQENLSKTAKPNTIHPSSKRESRPIAPAFCTAFQAPRIHRPSELSKSKPPRYLWRTLSPYWYPNVFFFWGGGYPVFLLFFGGGRGGSTRFSLFLPIYRTFWKSVPQIFQNWPNKGVLGMPFWTFLGGFLGLPVSFYLPNWCFLFG